MDGLFQELEGEVAILVSNGTYYQVPLYTRGGWLFAKWGGGFIRLMKDGSTTRAKVRLETLHFEGVLYADGMGRLSVNAGGCRRIDDTTALKLKGPE